MSRSIIKREQLRPTKPSPSTAAPDSAPAPTVELHRDGDEIAAIEMTCGCGRTTVIECRYEEESK